MVNPYGGTGIETYYDYGTCDTTTTGSIWASYTTGSTSAKTIIKEVKAYQDLVDQTCKVYWKNTDGTATAEDWHNLTKRAWEYNCGTQTSATYGTWNDGWTECREVKWNQPLQSPQLRLREIIRSRQAPLIITSPRTPMPIATDVRETRARETLLRVLGEDKFKRFLKHGFVSVQAKSGLVYQIFPGHGITNVYDAGEKVERLCVVLRGNFPPTDSLIMRYLLILNDERDFRSHAIKHTVYKKRPEEQAVIKKIEPLNEVWNRLKVVA